MKIELETAGLTPAEEKEVKENAEWAFNNNYFTDDGKYADNLKIFAAANEKHLYVNINDTWRRRCDRTAERSIADQFETMFDRAEEDLVSLREDEELFDD